MEGGENVEMREQVEHVDRSVQPGLYISKTAPYVMEVERGWERLGEVGQC